MNGKKFSGGVISQINCDAEPLLNPFVHRLELNSTYEKIKTAILTVILVPLRASLICFFVVMGWMLATIGLFGVTEQELHERPLDGWRKSMKQRIARLIFYIYTIGGIRLKVIGRPTTRAEAPVVALAPHSSFVDSLAMVYLGGPSIVAKGETASIPFFGRCCINISANRKLKNIICLLGQSSLMAGGMHFTIKGRQASREEAPILVVAPHSTFFDAGLVYLMGFPSTIVRTESVSFHIGKLINYTQPIYVWRDDPESRQKSVKEIIERATSKLDWPQILIFPEGTCTNRSCLISFKNGAFYPGVPIQPVCIRYPNKLDTVTWTWEGPSALKLLWLTLTQPTSQCEVEFLPVYHPSDEEKRDPKLFANNVRAVMAKALGVPVVDYTYNDCKLIVKAKEMNLPFANSLVEVRKLRRQLGLEDTNREEKLLDPTAMSKCFDYSRITFIEFMDILKLHTNEQLALQLFRIYDKNNIGLMDLRDYLLGVLAMENNKEVMDIVKIAFKLYDKNSNGKLTPENFSKALCQTLGINYDEATDIFNHIDKHRFGYVTYDNFINYAKNRHDFNSLFTDAVLKTGGRDNIEKKID